MRRASSTTSRTGRREGAADAGAVSRSGVADLLSGDRDWTAVAAIHCGRDDGYAMADMEGGRHLPDHRLHLVRRGQRPLSGLLQAGRPDVSLRRGGGSAGIWDLTRCSCGTWPIPPRATWRKSTTATWRCPRRRPWRPLSGDMRETLGEDTLLSLELPAAEALSGGRRGGERRGALPAPSSGGPAVPDRRGGGGAGGAGGRGCLGSGRGGPGGLPGLGGALTRLPRREDNGNGDGAGIPVDTRAVFC